MDHQWSLEVQQLNDVEPVGMRRTSVPVQVAGAVQIALQRVAADRFQTAEAFAATLKGELALPPQFSSPAGAPEGDGRGPSIPANPRRILAVAALVLAVGGVGGWLLSKAMAGPPAAPQVTSFTVPIPGGAFIAQAAQIALSPDGETLVFRGQGGLYRRPLSEFESELIPATEGAGNPFFSPDGRFLAFAQDRILKKVPVAGGPVTEIAPLPDGYLMGADWGEDGYVALSGFGGIQRLPEGGGPLEQITTMDLTSEHQHKWPQILDGGRRILFTAMGPSGQSHDSKVMVRDMESGDQRVVVEEAMFGRYLPTGHVLFANVQGTILVIPFDLEGMEVEGDAFAVESGVHVGAYGGVAHFAVSENGTAAFLRGDPWSDQVLWAVDRQGQRRRLGPPMRIYFVKISPDAERVALAVSRPGETDVHLLDLSSEELEHLTFDLPMEDGAVWHPDGTRIAFNSDWVGGVSRIFVKEIRSGAAPAPLFTGDHHIHLSDWSPDGRWLAFDYFVSGQGRDVYPLEVDNVENLLPVGNTTEDEAGGVFSPDGDWIAYEWEGEVFVAPFPPTGAKDQVSTSGNC